jgi:ribosomal protein S18
MNGKIYVRPEPRGSTRKFQAILPSGKIIRFGLRGYSDYTLHKDPDRMKRYVTRHGGVLPRGVSATTTDMLRVRRSLKENWSRRGIETPGFWSRWILWSYPSLKKAAQHTSRVTGVPVVLLK